MDPVARYVRKLEDAVIDLLPWAEEGARSLYRTNPAAAAMWNLIYDGYYEELVGSVVDTRIDREED